ncbi:RNA binding protein Pym [Cryomyces antarcticus]
MPSVASDPSSATFTSKAGIALTNDGERHIPSSKRPDGSVRKEIRVRPGYRPPEDVELYKNRTAEAWKSRAGYGVPGAEVVSVDKGIAATNKNAKRREARKKAALAASDDAGLEMDGGDAIGHGPETMGATQANKDTTAAEPVDAGTEKEKEAKKLSKKLRQARELEEKKEKGDSLLPEQFQKVIRINELIRQLNSLGFDADGLKKGTPREGPP